ncbi:uncharacterized protein MELLADRAFT_65597 [Melampsora larici-populina 98AG31]|uniref:Uncharacterized protein n=1 Tax=Melampsora larici-populina (strain 98AG31 / pathotype 3-4-7) TaxID=747676 RepID=F4RW06_MELLP|nr:uncharacterized protein MELLADRAFT_65597 [Melampsora larici-populina 98AG31]EGG03450.1 hypothetical protein MELLADRAFT_65597 [Melampsora larici-populina 98AG31]
MFRRSRIPISSVRISDPEESRQDHQFTPPGLQSDFEKALHIHQGTSISKPEQNPDRLTPAEGSNAVPPRLQALLRLDHLLRPSPLISSKVERRIVSEPFGRAPQWSIEEDAEFNYHRDRERRPFLSKSDQQPVSSSKNQLIKVQGLKSRYSVQVSDNDSDSHHSRDTHQSDTMSSKKSYRYNRSWAPSPPSSFSSITTNGDYKHNSSTSLFDSDGGVPSNDTEECYIPQLQPKRKSPQLVLKRSPTVGISRLQSSPLAPLPVHRSPERVSWSKRQKPYPDRTLEERNIDIGKKEDPTPIESVSRKLSTNHQSANTSAHPVEAIDKPNIERNLSLENMIASLPSVPRPPTREHLKHTSRPVSTTRNLRALSEPTPITEAYVPEAHTQVHFKSPADLSIARRKAATSRMKDSPENQSQTRTHKSLSNNVNDQTSIPHIDSNKITDTETPLNPLKSTIKPISTQGLSPLIKSLKYGLLQLALPKSDLTVEPFDGLEVRFWLKKEAIEYLGSESGDLIVIKQDGQTVQCMMRSPDFSSKAEPSTLETSIQKSIPLATFYHLSALPTYLLKLIKYIERNLELIKSQTPFLIFKISSLNYFQGARCLVMMNGEKPDIVIDWSGLQKIKISRKKRKVFVWNRNRGIEGNDRMSKMVGGCDAEGKIGDEFVEELREGCTKLKSESERVKEISLLDDRLDCLIRCIEMSDTVLKVFKGGTLRDTSPVTLHS